MSLIGLDIGTTGSRALIFAQDGVLLASARREYGISSPQPGWAEQDAEEVWQRTFSALQEALAIQRAVAPDDSPRALAISCQGEAVIPVDEAARPLHPAILGMDTRTTAENQWLVSTFGRDELFQRTGMAVHTINSLPKLLWLQRHRPELWRGTHQFLLYEDFFILRLTGKAIISHCLASRTQMYNLRRGEWDDEILSRCAIERERLAQVAPQTGDSIAETSAEITRQLGLDAPLMIASGGHDQACAALGAGVLNDGQAMVSTGTAEVVEVAMAQPVLSSALQASGISIYRHVVPGKYLAMTLNHCGGLLLRWLRDTLGKWEAMEASQRGVDPYDALLAGTDGAPSGLLLLPHFAGSGTPIMDAASRGALLGLTTATTLCQIALATLEGVTFELRQNLDLLRESGVAIGELRAVGGGARSAQWLQMKADICGVPVRRMSNPDAAGLGAAILAGSAIGVYASLEDAITATVVVQDRVLPRREQGARYAQWYDLYLRLYPQLAATLHEISCLTEQTDPGRENGH